MIFIVALVGLASEHLCWQRLAFPVWSPQWESPVRGVGIRESWHTGSLVSWWQLTYTQGGWGNGEGLTVRLFVDCSSKFMCVKASFSSSWCSDKLLAAPATSTSATKDPCEDGHDRRVGLTHVSCRTFQWLCKHLSITVREEWELRYSWNAPVWTLKTMKENKFQYKFKILKIMC